MTVWAYDVETIVNCFTVTFVDVKNEKNVRQFVIAMKMLKSLNLQDKYNGNFELVNFLDKEVLGLVSFNGVNFDRPVLRTVLRTGDAHQAYQHAQQIITEEQRPTPVSELIPELDLYLLYHFNNEARRTSLKWIQCHLGMTNIQEMPHPHDMPVINEQQLQDVLSYNLNDVITTVRFYNHPKTKELIEVRKWARKTYGIECRNSSNAHMGEMIFMRMMGHCPTPDKEPKIINLGDLILPIVKFKSDAFNGVLAYFKMIKIKTQSEIKASGMWVGFDEMRYEFGFGGLHAAREETIWEGLDSIDVKSFYPNLAIKFKFRPSHLGDSFTNTYSQLYEDRMRTKTPEANAALKEALNSVFGKSNSIYSPLYDPTMMYSITINGQMLMAMLAEEITLSGAGKVIMVNTDGMEIKVSNRQKYDEVLTWWKQLTGMPVAGAKYDKIMIKDVNNYLGYNKMSDKTKAKGIYQIEKDWNKDPSMRIAAIAAEQWFLKKTPVVKTVVNNNDLVNFFMFKRSKTGKMTLTDNQGVKTDAPKTIRYVIGDFGYVLTQETDKVTSRVHAKGKVAIMNNLDECIDDIKLDKFWYAMEANKLIVQPKAKELW